MEEPIGSRANNAIPKAALCHEVSELQLARTETSIGSSSFASTALASEAGYLK
jgi:hypothetical protein